LIEVRRAADRPISRSAGITTRHSFSSGSHYDPANTHFGRLVAHDEHVLEAGAGFDAHPHRGIDVVTWVLDGTLLHEDSTGRRTTVRRGTVQILLAGSGVVHSERNGGDGELRFVQMWLLGDSAVAPAYRLDGPAGVRLPGARLSVVSLADAPLTLPSAPFVHVYVSRGRADLTAAGLLATGDSARISPGNGHQIRGDGELVVIEMDEDAAA
jgi:redox-sensitive bicupin YhaK (pirin superfamily)